MNAYARSFRDRCYFAVTAPQFHRFSPWRRHRIRWWGLLSQRPPQ